MAARDLRRHCRTSGPVEALLRDAVNRLGLSARAYHRVLKIARTIADLEDSAELTTAHVGGGDSVPESGSPAGGVTVGSPRGVTNAEICIAGPLRTTGGGGPLLELAGRDGRHLGLGAEAPQGWRFPLEATKGQVRGRGRPLTTMLTAWPSTQAGIRRSISSLRSTTKIVVQRAFPHWPRPVLTTPGTAIHSSEWRASTVSMDVTAPSCSRARFAAVPHNYSRPVAVDVRRAPQRSACCGYQGSPD